MRMVGGRYGSTFTGLTAEAVLSVMFFNLQLEVIGSISCTQWLRHSTNNQEGRDTVDLVRASAVNC